MSAERDGYALRHKDSYYEQQDSNSANCCQLQLGRNLTRDSTRASTTNHHEQPVGSSQCTTDGGCTFETKIGYVEVQLHRNSNLDTYIEEDSDNTQHAVAECQWAALVLRRYLSECGLWNANTADDNERNGEYGNTDKQQWSNVAHAGLGCYSTYQDTCQQRCECTGE